MKGTLYDYAILDAMNLVKRFNWVFRELRDAQGRETGVIYGFLNHIVSLKGRFGELMKPVAVWDCKSLARWEVDPEYKANRPHEQDDPLWEQVRILKVCLSLWDIQQAYAEGYEADDVASALVKKWEGKHILLDSNDHDWWLMLSKTVHILQENVVKKRSDVELEKSIDLDSYLLYKAITGDKSDNIHGVSRVNRKVMGTILKSVGNSFDSFLNKCRKDGVLKEFLEEENVDLVRKNLELVTLVDKGYEIQYIDTMPDKDRLVELLGSYGMKKLIERISV